MAPIIKPIAEIHDLPTVESMQEIAAAHHAAVEILTTYLPDLSDEEASIVVDGLMNLMFKTIMHYVEGGTDTCN